MRVLCGQCGQAHDVDDDYDQPTVACSKCGHAIPISRTADGQPHADPAGMGEELGFAEQARQSTARKIPVTCPNCGKTVSVSARVAGRKARCKGCDQPLEIPYPDDLEEFEIPSLYQGDAEVETGLELIAPHQEQPEVAGPRREVESAVDLVPQPDLAPEPGAHDALAELASLNPAADLASLKTNLDFAQATAAPTQGTTGQLASAVQSFQEGKPAARAGQANRPRTARWLLLALLGGAALALPLAVVIPLLMTDDANLPGDPIDDGKNPAPRLVVTPTTKTVGSRSRPSSRPASSPQPSCKILAAVGAPFLARGYLPAGARSMYWRIAANVSAGKKPLQFKTHGADVGLLFGTKRFDSLGVPARGGGILPVRARKTSVSLGKQEARKLTFLFEVPLGLARGQLHIRGLAPQNVVLPAPQEPLAAAKLAGTYEETAPRNLKPLLRDPVMAAIQAAPHQKLVVSSHAGGIQVTIPQARVRGEGKQVAPGLFQTPLKREDHTLLASVRFVEGGRMAILYLADSPFHQLTYVNPKVPASAARRRPRPTEIKPLPAAETIWDDSHGFDPNAEPDPNEKLGPLPTGPSIFD